jgi:fructoselysine and glucoselysine-specific PTS system IID component
MSEMTQTMTGATQPQSDDASRITARDLRSVFWRSFTLQGSWNYERQQHMGYAFAMSPALKRIYQDPTELGRALQRHLVLFNTTPHLSTFIFGLSIAMEEENQRNPEFNEESINAIKTSLMGPLAGIGDSIFWGSLKVIAAGMGIYFAQQGSLLGPILALLVYNLPHLLCRWYGLKLGYRAVRPG